MRRLSDAGQKLSALLRLRRSLRSGSSLWILHLQARPRPTATQTHGGGPGLSWEGLGEGGGLAVGGGWLSNGSEASSNIHAAWRRLCNQLKGSTSDQRLGKQTRR